MRAPRLAIVGWSDSGKTTLLEALIPLLRAQGLRVAVLKHSSHRHPLHKSGSDTERLAAQAPEWVAFETPEGTQITLAAGDGWLPPCELLLVEGGKSRPGAKLEVAREGGPLLAATDASVLAVVGGEGSLPDGVARLSLSAPDQIATLVMSWWKAQTTGASSGELHPEAVTERGVRTVRAGTKTRPVPKVAVEAPLEIRVLGEPLATTMRTPGHDERLAVGFLWAEGILGSRQDLGKVSHCGRTDAEGYGNTLEVIPAPGVTFEVEKIKAARRGTLTTSACGVCGRQSIEDLLERRSPVAAGPTWEADRLRRAAEVLSPSQALFRATGGTHAAAVLDGQGSLLALYEDVGRHNAVDKVVGELVFRGLLEPRVPRTATALVVSGRASFEIVQKAMMARLPFVLSVSAASSLAIDLAERAGITLASFVRGEDFLLYTHPERVTGLL
jgi:FdhD protein